MEAETVTITLERFLNMQKRIEVLDKDIARQEKHIIKVADALEKEGISLTSNCEETELLVIFKDKK